MPMFRFFNQASSKIAPEVNKLTEKLTTGLRAKSIVFATGTLFGITASPIILNPEPSYPNYSTSSYIPHGK